MTRKLIATLFLLLSTLPKLYAVTSGSLVLNGTSEMEVLFNRNLQDLSFCLSYQSPVMDTPLERDIVFFIDTYRASGHKVLLFFKHNTDNFFNIKGEEKIAATGLKPNSPVYLNLDLLIKKRNDDKLSDEAVQAILVHELGHHYGVKDDAFLANVASKVARSCARKKVQQKHLAYWIGGDLGISVTTLDGPEKSSLVLNFGFNNQSMDLVPTLSKKTSCRSGEVATYEAHVVSRMHEHRKMGETYTLKYLLVVNEFCQYKMPSGVRKSGYALMPSTSHNKLYNLVFKAERVFRTKTSETSQMKIVQSGFKVFKVQLEPYRSRGSFDYFRDMQ